MKRIILIGVIALMFQACGSCTVDVDDVVWERLPVRIGVLRDSLTPDIEEAIEKLNESLGDVYVIDNSNPQVVISCDYKMAEEKEIGRYNLTFSSDYAWSPVYFDTGYIVTRCDYEDHVTTLAHELYHTLGFVGHSEDPSCISHHEYRPIMGMCQEMIDNFNQKYGR